MTRKIKQRLAMFVKRSETNPYLNKINKNFSFQQNVKHYR